MATFLRNNSPGLFWQRLAVGEDAARLGVADDPLRVEEGDGAALEDRLQVAAAALAPQHCLPFPSRQAGQRLLDTRAHGKHSKGFDSG